MFPEPKYINANGLRMAVYEEGEGAPVVLLHGFPELAFSWRHQLPALANAGFRAIAPDQRGYGKTSAPADIAAYGIDHLIADVHGLLDALELDKAIFVGHDWGAILLWHMAMLAPARIEKLVILNIPHYARPSRDPITIMRERLGDDFYIVNFQDSDEADLTFASDPRHFIDCSMRKNQISRERYDRLPPRHRVISLLRAFHNPRVSGDALLRGDELDYYANAFRESGFSGPINWYRNWTKNWERLANVDQQIDIPTLFIGADDDVVVSPHHIEAMKPLVNDLTVHMLDGCGHWSQQERPGDINRLMLEWLMQRR